MKKFIVSIITFSLTIIIGINLKPLYLIYKGSYKNKVFGSEIYYSIDKSEKKSKAKKLLLGDSVARQLFPNSLNNDEINSIACNQTIEMVGQYILLKNYFYAGNRIDTVFLFCTPFSFKSNLNSKFTYHYFLKPFYNKNNKKIFSPLVIEQIKKIPYYYLCNFPYILTSNWAPNLIVKDSAEYTFLSPISVEYLIKMVELSKTNNFKLIILPTPTSINKKPLIDKMTKSEITKNNLNSEFKKFFENIIYIDDSLFIDGTHFKNPSQYKIILNQILHNQKRF